MQWACCLVSPITPGGVYPTHVLLFHHLLHRYHQGPRKAPESTCAEHTAVWRRLSAFFIAAAVRVAVTHAYMSSVAMRLLCCSTCLYCFSSMHVSHCTSTTPCAPSSNCCSRQVAAPFSPLTRPVVWVAELVQHRVLHAHCAAQRSFLFVVVVTGCCCCPQRAAGHIELMLGGCCCLKAGCALPKPHLTKQFERRNMNPPVD